MEKVFVLNVIGETLLPHFAVADPTSRTQLRPGNRNRVMQYQAPARCLHSGRKQKGIQPRTLLSSSRRPMAAVGEDFGKNEEKRKVKLKVWSVENRHNNNSHRK